MTVTLGEEVMLLSLDDDSGRAKERVAPHSPGSRIRQLCHGHDVIAPGRRVEDIRSAFRQVSGSTKLVIAAGERPGTAAGPSVDRGTRDRLRTAHSVTSQGVPS
ncbi:hypothetical protein ABTX81_03385 [Kitasatospora sp. NPDC097605]|uniref:hypothetical protein n=1 Tax=Kitasatospora sp. NPDC097605 TaxID=3157226 RepID=UPI00332E64B0